MKILTLLSGGQDSTTCLFWAKRQWPDAEHHALSFRYGQRHAIELERAAEIAKLARVKHHTLTSELGKLVESALTRPEQALRTTGGPANLPTSFVPGRNLIFLSYAAAFAGAIGAEKIVIGVSAVDYSGYPDCRPQFIVAMQHAVRLALDGLPAPTLVTPLVATSKAQTVRLARELGPACWTALGRSWTCYDPQPGDEQEARAAAWRTIDFDPVGRVEHFEGVLARTREALATPCRSCPACVLRAKGFEEAGEEDPCRS